MRLFFLTTWLFLNAQQCIADSYLKNLTSSGRDRSYWIHTPDDSDDNKQYPLVVAFHGSSEIGIDADGLAMELDIRLSLPVVQTQYSKDVSGCQRAKVVINPEANYALEILRLPKRRRGCLGWP